MVNIRFVITLIAFVFLYGCASTDEPAQEQACFTCIYVIGGVGEADTDSSTDGDSSFVGSVDEDSTTWSIGLGLQIHKHVALEANYVDFDEFTYDGLYMGAPSSGDVESDGWSASVVGSYPVIPQYGIEVYGEAGMLWWDSKETEDMVGTDSESGSDFMWGIGLKAPIGSTPIEVKAGYTEYEIWDNDVETITGEVLYRFH